MINKHIQNNFQTNHGNKLPKTELPIHKNITIDDVVNNIADNLRAKCCNLLIVIC